MGPIPSLCSGRNQRGRGANNHHFQHCSCPLPASGQQDLVTINGCARPVGRLEGALPICRVSVEVRWQLVACHLFFCGSSAATGRGPGTTMPYEAEHAAGTPGGSMGLAEDWAKIIFAPFLAQAWLWGTHF